MSLWGKDADPIRPITPGERLHCLACGSSGPFASCVIGRDYAIRDNKLISEPSSDRVACQRCGAQFTFSAEGSFQHHAQAEPFTGSARPTNGGTREPHIPLDETPASAQPPRVPWPEARQKPSY